MQGLEYSALILPSPKLKFDYLIWGGFKKIGRKVAFSFYGQFFNISFWLIISFTFYIALRIYPLEAACKSKWVRRHFKPSNP